MPPHLSGWGKQGLAQKIQLLGEDRQFARLGFFELAIDADQVAKIELLRKAQPVSPTSFCPIMTWM